MSLQRHVSAMTLADWQALALWQTMAIFVAAAAAVWFAGTRLVRYADVIQMRTGAGEALVGMLMLGCITALPELSVTVTSAHGGNAPLAVNNLLGGMAFNVAILAVADAAIRREVLTAAVATPAPLLQAALLILLLTLVAGATVVGDVEFFGAGAWSWLIVAVYLLSIRVIGHTMGRPSWVPAEAPRSKRKPKRRESGERANLRQTVLKTAAAAAVILVAGYLLATTGEALAAKTGLGASFFGAVFLAISTSLPEISTVFSAVRIGRYEMAISDIFGANLFCLALIFVVDMVYSGGPVLSEVGGFSSFAALLGIAVVSLFIAGLVERAHYKILRMGVDSLLVLGTYVGGVAVLYVLR